MDYDKLTEAHKHADDTVTSLKEEISKLFMKIDEDQANFKTDLANEKNAFEDEK